MAKVTTTAPPAYDFLMNVMLCIGNILDSKQTYMAISHQSSGSLLDFNVFINKTQST